MKVKSLALVLSILTASSFAALAADEAKPNVINGGTVHFKGELVNAACAVDVGSVDKMVPLGQVRTARLTKSGDTSSAVNFNIQLNDCDTTVSQTAKVAFSGISAGSANPTVIPVASSAAGAATNVGVQILDSKSIPLTLDGSGFGSAITLHNGTNTLPFQARYYALGETTPGTANADATFSVQYE